MAQKKKKAVKKAKPVKKAGKTAVAKKKPKKAVKKPKSVASKSKKPVIKSMKGKIKKLTKPAKVLPKAPLKKPVKPIVVKPQIQKPIPPAKPVAAVPPVKAPSTRKPVAPPQPPPPPPPPVKKVITIVRSETDKKKPEPAGKYSLEYIIHAPLAIIFEMLSTPSGLSEWFADDVNVKEGAFVFFWDGIPQMAKLVNYKDDRLVRFQWEGRNDGKYFEFRLQTDELTNEVSLFVTDFLEEGSDMPSAKLLWDKQISNLKHLLGS